MIAFPHCKINLGLSIVAKRADGYHELETIFYPVALQDMVEIVHSDQTATDIQFTHTGLAIPGDESNNLCIKAYHLLKKDFPNLPNIKLHLHKVIPTGAGLGGGSSDAATVLKALDLTLGTGLSICELESIAASLGSDIPFFIRSSPSLCRGRGEIVEPLGILPKANILLVKPPFPVPTAWAYRAYKNKTKTFETFSQWHGSIELMNDLEEPVFSKYLVLPVLKRWLLDQSGVRCAMMSGSGSTIFAILNEDVLDLEDRVLAYFGPSFLVRRCQLLGTHHTDHC